MPKRIRELTQLTPAAGDYLVADKPGGATYRLPLGQANGVPFLDALTALAANDAYLNRGYVASAVDWNTLTAAGVYKIHGHAFGSGAANYPPTSYDYGILLVFRSHTPAVIAQIYVPHVIDDFIYFRQAWVDSDWSPWRAVGAKFGANSHGSFIRFADGTQVCWAVNVGTGPDPQTIVYPAAFVSPPAVAAVPADWPPALISVDSAWGYGTTQQRFRKYLPNGVVYTGTAYGFNYVAIGRWK
ncbi:MAG: pyocin knob domain-containing protein [Thermus aquaticus]|uniref:pyocin knob domain-containing protein n=1 Tax=Thermus aquaticus TaxID=271 RepID=UPI003C069632